MKYARTGTVRFTDDDGDYIVLREEPFGSQYDQRIKLLGNMRIPANLIEDGAAMQDLFKSGEMIEINMDKEALTEYQFKALFVEMCVAGHIISATSDAVYEYRRFDLATKTWIDEQVDSVWKSHEDNVQAIVSAEGESVQPPDLSSVDDTPQSD